MEDGRAIGYWPRIGSIEGNRRMFDVLDGVLELNVLFWAGEWWREKGFRG